jgi:mono/diheme cytochrome c family protein
MKPRLAALGASMTLLGVLLALGPQNSATQSTPRRDSSISSELSKAPPKARSKRNPLENYPSAIAAGRNLFARHCAPCHGAGAGGGKGPSLRAEEVQNSTPGALFWILTNGVVRRGMPVWSKLPEPQRWQLVTYIQSLGIQPADSRTTAPTKPEWPASTESPAWPLH